MGGQVPARFGNVVARGPAAAADNRAAILTAARAVFSRHGPSAPMSLISTTAGVSPGVLYRHFPSRELLARAVFEQDLEAIEKVAAHPDCTLESLLAAFLDQLVECTAFVDARRPDEHEPAHAAVALRVDELLTQKLEKVSPHTLRAEAQRVYLNPLARVEGKAHVAVLSL
ncbi:helix-turn-helix domain-containing protein [Nocardia abscessus]|uniref:helix-turn-helix domain-containing protein n=1 Tax=Nocardia abscessus TaxID=120957 RepID=UPI002454E1BF|nr:helix-turn-helix domain-containing protein [Nocardia abscessus]